MEAPTFPRKPFPPPQRPQSGPHPAQERGVGPIKTPPPGREQGLLTHSGTRETYRFRFRHTIRPRVPRPKSK